MKRLPLLGLVLALASCGTSIDNTDQALACYDTGSGMKCVPLDDDTVLTARELGICLGDR